jgi:hypothetical protein
MRTTTDEYAEGFSLGCEYADADRANHYPFAATEHELRWEAREAHAHDSSRAWIAFKLGIVRGYRETTRTLRNGRWGT